MQSVGDFQSFLRRQQAPVTLSLIAGIVGVSVVLFLFHNAGELLWVVPGSFSQPWRLLTYPFAEGLDSGFKLILMLFLAFWLYWVGTSTERDIGSLRLGILWLVATLLGSLCIAIAGEAIHTPYVLAGSLVPVSVLTVIWCVRNRTGLVRLMMFIPITGFWLAWLTVAIVFVEFGRTNLFLGAVACLPLAAGWAYATNRIPGLAYGKPANVYRPSKAQRAKEAAFLDDVRKREKEREERERLRKLFEGSRDD